MNEISLKWTDARPAEGPCGELYAAPGRYCVLTYLGRVFGSGRIYHSWSSSTGAAVVEDVVSDGFSLYRRVFYDVISGDILTHSSAWDATHGVGTQREGRELGTIHIVDDVGRALADASARSEEARAAKRRANAAARVAYDAVCEAESAARASSEHHHESACCYVRRPRSEAVAA